MDPLNKTLSIPEPQPHVAGDLKFRGDLVGFARSSTVYPMLSDRGKLSLLVLANAKVFVMDAIGYAGSLPPQARAFRNLLKEARAADAFSELVGSASPPAQLYGLSGLYLVDRDNYEKHAVQLRRGNARVRTFIGCSLDEQAVAYVIGKGNPDRWEIAGGWWPLALAGRK
jgi:hypothetical protein